MGPTTYTPHGHTVTTSHNYIRTPITGPPQFSSEERVWTAKEGDKVRIPCQFRNRYDGMSYTIVWKDGEHITINDERLIKDGYDLVIMNVTSKDTLKKYFCEVKIPGLSTFFNSPLNSVKLISEYHYVHEHTSTHM